MKQILFFQVLDLVYSGVFYAVIYQKGTIHLSHPSEY